MSVEEKQPFLDMAETLKRQHHIDHPDYKFKPKQRATNGTKTNTKKNSAVARPLIQMCCCLLFEPMSSRVSR
jgi:hypothetical protein